jgi:hypothetical protein
MAQANVVSAGTAHTWYTDKARISTGNTSILYNVDIYHPTYTGNLFSELNQIPAFSTRDVWVGVNNMLHISGSDWTAQELGTASSGNVVTNT